jgi:hypothetical protein
LIRIHPTCKATLEERLEEVRTATGEGIPTVQRVPLDWRDLEPSAGVYDTAPMLETLENFNDDNNEYIFVLVATVDSDGITGVHPDDAELRPYSDSCLWQRFSSLLQQAVVLPILQANQRVFLLFVGNEPGSCFEKNPEELLPLTIFLNQTRDWVHETVPDLSVGLTMDRIFLEIANAQYGLNSDLTADFLTAIDDPQDLVRTLREKQSIFGFDRRFVVQELGMPSGWEHRDSFIGTDPCFATMVLDVMIREFLETPSWRVAFWFTTVDWSVDVTELYMGALRADDSVPTFLVLRLEEWPRTGGLLRYQQLTMNGTVDKLSRDLSGLSFCGV